MSMAEDVGIVERILKHLGWQPDRDEARDEARLRDQQRRLRALETRVAVRERADREAIAEIDRLDAEEDTRGHP